MFADSTEIVSLVEAASTAGIDLRLIGDQPDQPAYVGRAPELLRAKVRLFCATKRNILLIGAAGGGKTTFVRQLAHEVRTSSRRMLARLVFFEASIGGMLAGTRYRGEFERRVAELVKLLRPYENIVLFFDEAHAMTATGGEAGIAMPDLLKPHLLNGDLRVILATTDAEVRAFASDGAFMRRFDIIRLQELDGEERVLALRKHIAFLERFHRITLSDSEVIERLLTASARELHCVIDELDFEISKLSIEGHTHA